MKKKVFWVKVAVAALLLATTAGLHADPLDPFKGESGTLRIAGGTAHIPVMKEAARLIMGVNPAINVTIAGGGSGVGIKQVGEGLVDIGNSGRKPTEGEIARYDLKLFEWAIDGVAVVVHPRNPIRNLNRATLQEIFTGKILNWKALGGADRGINLYTRDEASGTREVFWQIALDQKETAAKANVVVSNGAMKAAISGDPYGIGYVSVGHIDQTVAPVAIDGISPTLVNVRERKYTISRGLFSNTRREPTGLTKKFIDFLFTPRGRQIAADNGFIPIE